MAFNAYLLRKMGQATSTCTIGINKTSSRSACSHAAPRHRPRISVQIKRKDEELEALRAQLAKSAATMEEVGTLRADVEELRQAAESEREAAMRAASEARQEADVAKQLRCSAL